MRKYLTIKEREFGAGKPIVCVPVLEHDKESIIADVRELVSQGVDMVEWRVDAFDHYDSMNAIREVLEELRPIVEHTVFMYTYRSRRQGGFGRHDRELRRDIHEVAGESKMVDIVDIEFFSEDRPVAEIRKLRKMGMKVMASHHDFEGTPHADVIRILLEEELQSGADLVKLAVQVNSMEDVLTLIEETCRFHKEYPGIPLIANPMGTIGSFVRLIGEYTGSCVTWGSWKQETAAGQLPQEELRKLLDQIHTIC